MPLPVAVVSVTANYQQQSTNNTGGTVTEQYTDTSTINAAAAASAPYSYVADGSRHPLLTSSGSVALVLSALAGAIGTIALGHVLWVKITNTSPTDVLTVGGGTHPFAPLGTAITLYPGGTIVLAAAATGYAVAAGSADTITIAVGTVSAPVGFTVTLVGY